MDFNSYFDIYSVLHYNSSNLTLQGIFNTLTVNLGDSAVPLPLYKDGGLLLSPKSECKKLMVVLHSIETP
jgi:hypothetical protein